MRIILLSGGSGKRLWPLSNGYRSKVFLKLLAASTGKTESMLQRVIRQLDSADLLNSSIVVAHHTQNDLILDQIGDVIPIISEPYRRGTFNAIALSAVYLSDHKKARLDEILCVLPVDLFVNVDFYEVIKRLPFILAKSSGDIALLGVTPTKNSDQYGYILPKQTIDKEYHEILHFVEKPNKPTARSLIKKQALWNCGIFAFKLGFILDVIEQKHLPTGFEKLTSQFQQLSESSFDEEVVERTSNTIVVPYNGSWHDLGSWESLTQQLSSNVMGPGSLSHESTNTQLINQLSIPIHVIGAKDMIVVASPDGVLVASKKDSNNIKKVLSEFETEQGEIYEEKRWDSITLLDNRCDDGRLWIRTAKIKMFAGAHSQFKAQEGYQIYIIILSGIGEFVVNDHHRAIHAGEVVNLSVGIHYMIKSTTPLEYIEIEIRNFTPAYSADNIH